jgi:23S rRNA (cytosine1962-C5)-methyltransferase
MIQEKKEMFRNRLIKVSRHIGKEARRLGVTCYRVYDHDLPDFPFCIERYENLAYVAEYLRRHGMSEEEHLAWQESCLPVISEILDIPKEQIFLRERRRKPGRQGQYHRLDESGNFHIVKENGLQFRINLKDYLDSGLFLDHRVTRQRVREEAKGKQLLNLFCYTGSFSVYAAAGGAAGSCSVDLSNTYLAWAKENMKLNQLLDPDRHEFVQGDVRQFLDQLSPASYDLVVLDPPTFSNSKRMQGFLDIQRDHVGLIQQVLRATKPGGILYFSTNFRHFQLDRPAISCTAIEDVTRSTTPFDFRSGQTRSCFRMVR